MAFDLDEEENEATRIANGASKEIMENIEIGEYVRTDKGHIFKIDKEKKNLQIAKFLNVEYGNIVKHSKKLENLIEINDIVNGYRILGIYEAIAPDDERILDIDYGMAIFNDEIKTILTKENYIANCYKVGGEDE